MTSHSSRRSFLKTTAGSALAIGLSRKPIEAQDTAEWRNRHEQMKYRRLGRTGFMVSEIVMGGNEITPENYEHVLMALDRGLNYLDTSPAYGRGKSEQGYARVIKARPRDQFFLTSKVSPWDMNRNQLFAQIFDSLSESEQKRLRTKAADEIEERNAANPTYLVNYFGGQKGELEASALSNVMEKEYGRRIDREKNYKQIILDSVDQSLQALGTDHLDILMCPHGASSPTEISAFPEVFEAFENLKRAGKVRHLGVSSHSDPGGVLAAAVASNVYSVAMVAYNIVNHSFMDQIVEQAHDADFGVIAMKVARAVFPGPNRGDGNAEGIKALNERIPGDWTMPQKAYLWALKNQNLSAVISNMVNADQVRDNIALPLS